ncbi:hypothetical protein VTP01DRAFT_4044 [Rhizomucor pusillus]|uniref:uncharacterized protein n=1 Tax=Rhizomucor pusillus TaxID=4840 RepID=UPI00374314CE
MLIAHKDTEKHLQYLRRIGKSKNRPTYADDFHKAYETFLYQTVYDPDRNVVVPLNVPPNIIECLDNIKANIPKHTRDIIQARKSSTRVTNSKDHPTRKEFADIVGCLQEGDKEKNCSPQGKKYFKKLLPLRENRDTALLRATLSARRAAPRALQSAELSEPCK